MSRRTLRASAATLTAGAAATLLGVAPVARNDAACIVQVLHPLIEESPTPSTSKSWTSSPLQWSCSWPDVPGGGTTTYVDPFASLLYYCGLTGVLVGLLMAAHLLLARKRKVDGTFPLLRLSLVSHRPDTHRLPLVPSHQCLDREKTERRFWLCALLAVDRSGHSVGDALVSLGAGRDGHEYQHDSDRDAR